VKRVVQRNQRGRFGHSVALHHHQTHRVPELFNRARQRPAARDDRPELQSHRPVHIAEPPPAQQEGNAGCCTLWTCRALLKSRQCRFDVRLQQRQHAWHGSQHRDALPPYRRNQPRRNQAAFKMQARRRKWVVPIAPWSAQRRGSAAAYAESAADGSEVRIASRAATPSRLGQCWPARFHASAQFLWGRPLCRR
jgi:hypothetical protein